VGPRRSRPGRRADRVRVRHADRRVDRLLGEVCQQQLGQLFRFRSQDRLVCPVDHLESIRTRHPARGADILATGNCQPVGLPQRLKNTSDVTVRAAWAGSS
jgi:hypothetical protein